ncbi:IclR family transcriptional regulator [Terrabacter sp. C0L_2]|uniref:IclR family transcriptional regulator n=1 Tax=Terrabacter sp. C0L_2 TaxID=3108389 RepID=UPI002ED21C3A|nr:IclR family transcriptional regulator [Terrabacter sp. C0L_2]
MSGPVQSVERAAAIVQLLASTEEPLGLAQIAAALSLAKTTAHGLLGTLCDVRFVEKDEDGCYRVGRDLLQIGSTRLDPNELRAHALNWTDALAARTGCAARVAMFREGTAIIAHHVFAIGSQEQTLEVGRRIPLHATALGKVLLAFDPGAARSVLTRPVQSFTFRTITERSALLRELADIRENGLAVAVGECEPEIAGIAAPVRDRGGYVVASVGITGSVDELCDARHRPRQTLEDEVLRVARAVSREFGHGRAA